MALACWDLCEAEGGGVGGAVGGEKCKTCPRAGMQQWARQGQEVWSGLGEPIPHLTCQPQPSTGTPRGTLRTLNLLPILSVPADPSTQPCSGGETREAFHMSIPTFERQFLTFKVCVFRDSEK